MKSNFDTALRGILAHEGGFVNHKDDPGGATNKGVTIGTLRRLGIDVDGDGDSDLVDLKGLRHEHVARVYKLFYWDAVKADELPKVLRYATFDAAVNSGVTQAAKWLQRAVGAVDDGVIGPATIRMANGPNPEAAARRMLGARLRFMTELHTWPAFGRGWSRRIVKSLPTGRSGAAR